MTMMDHQGAHALAAMIEDHLHTHPAIGRNLRAIDVPIPDHHCGPDRDETHDPI